MVFSKNIIGIMTEACKTESENIDNLSDGDVKQQLMSDIDDMEEIEESLLFRPEMVPVFEQNGKFYIDAIDLYRVMESCKECGEACDEKEAIDKIIDSNKDDGVTLEQTYVVFESDTYLKKVIKEMEEDIKNTSDVSKKAEKRAVFITTKDAFKNVINMGIQVAKKKSQ